MAGRVARGKSGRCARTPQCETAGWDELSLMTQMLVDWCSGFAPAWRLLSISNMERDMLQEVRNMGGKTDQATGRAKEAVGVLVGDKDLEREGKVQRAAGDIKEKAEEIADDVKKAAAKVVDKVKDAIKR